MADFRKIKAMSRKECKELFLNFDKLYEKVWLLFSNSKGEEHKAYSRVLDVISDIAIKRELEPCRVKIVRCKDCKHYHNTQCFHPSYGDDCAINTERAENDFCSYGERKEAANDKQKT